jgi:hypothetical protein
MNEDFDAGRLAALWLAAGVLSLPASALWAQDARQIMEEAQKRNRAASQKYEGLLQVYDRSGKVTEKRWVSLRQGSFGNSKVVLRFTEPAEVKGVALLILNHTDHASDQWMWTPSIGRERRIATQDRSTRFFGTDFSFEDLEERDVDQFDYKLLGEETVDGAKCWHIEARPKKTKTSQYSGLQEWIRQDNYVTARIDCLVKDQPARRLKYSQIENIQGLWTARLFDMTDLKRQSHTLLKLERLQYNVPVKDEDFTVAALRQE